MIRAHSAAILAKLEAVSDLDVYDGIVPNLPAFPYLVLWASAPDMRTGRLSGEQQEALQRFNTVAVGLTAEQIRWVQEKVNAALLSQPITVTGRKSERIQHEYWVPVAYDYDVDPPLLSAVGLWRFLSVPA